MHLEILSNEQTELLPVLSQFKREYYLVGGTAIALHIGHRESIDFDLFKQKSIRKKDVYTKLKNVDYKVSFADYNQINMLSNGVKITFFSFPYAVPLDSELKGVLKMPDLLTLAAMKAFALGRRSKWKDYVDLYFIIKFHFSFSLIAKKAKDVFKDEFIEKQFIAQLGYFKGINYDEEVTFLIPNPPTEEEIQEFLTEISISGLADL
ncbi:nucleotidyl transferase AbiEii/AbiGii toxin family protein [Flavobacterium restrictum]|uniref:Nucleotidyl transferase AbiEii/AbiGii toxin family protein n=1 Tax=Flavobacterium restrictum TaxID=2594428 RepID=A0A553E900_9FLAO|nr:nucleotidyl transferase AbiEii/AbiGii toxin family protein [Flavobacterium restrictum]TRX41506.1 nucleotidyl transferase AbiEii/AbiGii toxin family protein [Flavobacterium restrictum]